MAVTKILARGFNFELNTGTIGVPVWVAIGGVNSFSFDPAKTDADLTDFDDNGRSAHMVASRSVSMSIDGFFMVDVDTGTRDAGQAAVETWANEIGPDSLMQFRFYQEDTLEGKSFMASANTTGPGGGINDPASWKVEITSSGAITDITVVP